MNIRTHQTETEMTFTNETSICLQYTRRKTPQIFSNSPVNVDFESLPLNSVC